ncbi:MAG: GyrI-like domain-containing protein [Haliscomenobacter sp.]|nr:GyrI-like domain-containing protein [Haliscomenobacter sp.]
MEQNKSVEVKHLPKTKVAYLRHIGPYKGDSELFGRLFNQLFSWAGPRGLLAQPHFQPIVIYHDDPSITDESKYRISVCLTVPENTPVDGELGLMEIEEGKYVVARFVVAPTEFEKAWNWVFGEWFPSSGYQPDDKPCFEAYPEPAHDGNITVDICVPVKPI